MKFIHNYLCPLNQYLQSETFCEILKHCAQCVSSSSLKWRVDPRFSYWVYLQSQLNSHVKTRSLEQFSSRFPMNTFNYRSLVGILEFLWKNACGIFWARVIRKTYDGEFGHLNLILETWNEKLIENIWSTKAKILQEKLKIQASFKVRFLRRNDEMLWIKNFKAWEIEHANILNIFICSADEMFQRILQGRCCSVFYGGKHPGYDGFKSPKRSLGRHHRRSGWRW